MCISLYRHKYVTETDIVGDKEGGMRVKRRAVNTLDGRSLPDMDICFHLREIKIQMRLKRKIEDIWRINWMGVCQICGHDSKIWNMEYGIHMLPSQKD